MWAVRQIAKKQKGWETDNQEAECCPRLYCRSRGSTLQILPRIHCVRLPFFRDLSGCFSSLGQEGEQRSPESPESFPCTTVCTHELSTDPERPSIPSTPGMVGRGAAGTHAASHTAVELYKDKISTAGLRDSQVFK